jgi:hypothetical protein
MKLIDVARGEEYVITLWPGLLQTCESENQEGGR